MLKNISLWFAGLDRLQDGGSIKTRYEFVGDDDRVHGTLGVHVPPTDKHTVDSQIAVAHRILANKLRAWADDLDAHATVLEDRSDG